MNYLDKITFKNVSGDKEDELIKQAIRSLEFNKEAITSFMNLEYLEDSTEDYGVFDEYPLSVGFVKQDGKQAAYVRYQISWGGPSSEIRIYYGDNRIIEYVFLDWFVGIGFDITGEDWAEWLADYYEPLFEKYYPDIQ